jgi:hypothetical protein
MSKRPRRASILFFVIVAIATAGMAFSTWKTWPDAMYDFGSQLYYPWQMNAGKHLYVDIAYFNGPLSQYFNAAMFRIFGVSLRTLVWVNLFIVLIVQVLIYRIMHRLAGQLTATCGCVVFALIFAFSQYVGIANYNWMCPYTHEVTHGVALSLAMIAALFAFIESGRRGPLVLAGGLCGLVFLTKAEVFVPAATAVFGGMILWARGAGITRLWSALIWFMLPAIAVVMIALFLLGFSSGWPVAVRGIEGSWPWIFNRQIASLQFYRQGLGIDDPAGNLWKMLVIGIASGAIVAGIVAAGLFPKRYRNFGLAIVVIEAIALLFLRPWTMQIARPWPVFVGLIAAVSIFRAWKSGTLDRLRWILRSIFAVFALALLGKMLLNARIWQYGFALAVPAAMVLIDALLGWIPAEITARGGDGSRARLASVLFLSALVFCIMANQLHQNGQPVGSNADQFVPGGRGDEVVDAVARVNQLLPPAGTLAVMPQGLMLNYLSRRVDPISAVNLMPPEVLSVGEDAVVAELNSHPPDLIVLSEKDIRDRAFVLTEGNYLYGGKIVDWVLAHYVCILPPSPSSELKLSYWRKKSAG